MGHWLIEDIEQGDKVGDFEQGDKVGWFWTGWQGWVILNRVTRVGDFEQSDKGVWFWTGWQGWVILNWMTRVGYFEQNDNGGEFEQGDKGGWFLNRVIDFNSPAGEFKVNYENRIAVNLFLILTLCSPPLIPHSSLFHSTFVPPLRLIFLSLRFSTPPIYFDLVTGGTCFLLASGGKGIALNSSMPPLGTIRPTIFIIVFTYSVKSGPQKWLTSKFTRALYTIMVVHHVHKVEYCVRRKQSRVTLLSVVAS